MPVLTSSSTTYEFELTEITKLIAADLRVPEECVNVQYVLATRYTDSMDRFSSPDYVVSKIRVTVDKSKGTPGLSEGQR